MAKKLNKAGGVLSFLLFISGTIVFPAYHTTHCTDNDATHKAGNCPVCHFANTPVITTSPVAAPLAGPVAIGNVDVQVSTLKSAALRDPTQPRAPPVV